MLASSPAQSVIEPIRTQCVIRRLSIKFVSEKWFDMGGNDARKEYGLITTDCPSKISAVYEV